MKSLVAVTIEPIIDQVIAAIMQRDSLQSTTGEIDYRLTVINSANGCSKAIAKIAEDAGISCRIAQQHPINPYLNKFIGILNLPNTTQTTSIVILDWDIIATRPLDFPHPRPGGISGRRNPPELYPEEAEKRLAQLGTSVNSGVLLGSLKDFKALNYDIEHLIRSDVCASCMAPLWRQEQFLVSVGLSKTDFIPLSNEWNATPLSPVVPEEVFLWHYNDSTHWTRVLKRNLTRPKTVYSLFVENLSDENPLRCRFLELYSVVISSPYISAFLV